MEDLDIPANTKPLLGFHDISNTFDFSVNSVSPSFFLDILHFSNQNFNPFHFLFDDGFSSILPYTNQLLPFHPKISIITEFIGKNSNWDKRLGGLEKKHLTSDEIKKISSAGWKIISHSHTHRALDCLKPEDIKKELLVSKHIIEEITHQPCDELSFPFGRYNEQVLDIAFSVGYRHFYSNRLGKTDARVQPVFSVYRWENINTIQKKINKNKREILKLRLINYCSIGTVIMQKVLGYKNEKY